jgi:DNA polymerase phi
MALVRAILLLYARQAFILSWLNSQLLNRVPESVRVARMLELLDEYTLVTAGLKGREERDLVFGKLFGMHAIVQSNILARATLPDLEKLVKESCFGVLISLLSKQTPFNTELQSLIVTSTLSSGIDTPESLWLALSCNKLSVDITDATLEKRWKSKQIVSLENVAVLAEILKETTFGHPHVHAVWDAVLECVFELKQLSVHDFWHNLVEGLLKYLLSYL